MVRDQISDLLNPEGVEQVHLSDEQLANDYSIVTTNNYIGGPYRSALHRRMVYDSVHGFYVVLDIRPLK